MPFLKLDDALIEMIKGHRDTVAKFLGYAHCGASLWDAEIAWDFPMSKTDVWDEEDATVSHSVGFLCGVAAAFDVTPLELLDVIKSIDAPVMRVLTTHELMEAQGFARPDGDRPRLKRPTAKQRQKIQIPPKERPEPSHPRRKMPKAK